LEPASNTQALEDQMQAIEYENTKGSKSKHYSNLNKWTMAFLPLLI